MNPTSTIQTIIKLLNHSDDLTPILNNDTTLSIINTPTLITIKHNTLDQSITVNDETTYSNLDEFTSNFFQDYI